MEGFEPCSLAEEETRLVGEALLSGRLRLCIFILLYSLSVAGNHQNTVPSILTNFDSLRREIREPVPVSDVPKVVFARR